MDVERPEPRASAEHTGRRGKTTWVAVVWLRVVVGLALAASGGAAIGHAWTNESTPWWGIGGTTLMVGVLLVLSGLYARSRPQGLLPHVIITEEPTGGREPSVPLLGALLVYKYQVITHRQLREALDEQKKTAPRRRLGEILVLKGLITVGELEEALSFQQSCMVEGGSAEGEEIPADDGVDSHSPLAGPAPSE